MTKINLGCCQWKLDGFINIDIDPQWKPEIVADITKGLPMFEDNSVDEIYAGHFLEHLDMYESDIAMKEWKRVLKPGGVITITIPDFEKGYKEYREGKLTLEWFNQIIFGDSHRNPMAHCQAFNQELLIERMRLYFREVEEVAVEDCDYLVAKVHWQSIARGKK